MAIFKAFFFFFFDLEELFSATSTLVSSERFFRFFAEPVLFLEEEASPLFFLVLDL